MLIKDFEIQNITQIWKYLPYYYFISNKFNYEILMLVCIAVDSYVSECFDKYYLKILQIMSFKCIHVVSNNKYWYCYQFIVIIEKVQYNLPATLLPLLFITL